MQVVVRACKIMLLPPRPYQNLGVRSDNAKTPGGPRARMFLYGIQLCPVGETESRYAAGPPTQHPFSPFLGDESLTSSGVVTEAPLTMLTSK